MRLILFFLFSITISVGFGQGQSCFSDVKHQELMKNSDYAQLIKDNEKKLQIRLNQSAAKIGANDTLMIPIVVHVIHLGEPVGVGTNISDAQINSAIDHLNSAYANTAGGSVDTKIQFCLAKRDPDCNATTGIVRLNGSGVTLYGTQGIDANGSDGKGADEKSVKDLSRWPNNAYYNIWVVSEIDDNDGGSGTQGYAYFPGSSSNVDGTVILHNAFGYDPGGAIGYNLKSYTNRNSTTVHELGHGMNLYHTFQGDDGNNDGIPDQCPTDAVCGTSGDCVNDTKKHQRVTTCTAGPNTCDSGDITDVAHNYMGYGSQTCRTEYTTGQKDRMRAALEALRPGLISSQVCVAPGASVTAASCNPTVNASHNAVGVSSFKMHTMEVNSNINDNGSSISDFSCSHFVELEPSTQYNLEIKHSANNEIVKVYIDYNNDGDFTDAGEDVYSGAAANLHSGSFTTPASPTLDTYLRVRVMSDFFPYAINSPCQNLTLGEIEEYAVKIVDNSGPVVPATALKAGDCGSTLGTLSEAIFCDQVLGATNYEWNIVNVGQGLNHVERSGTSYNGYRLSWVPGMQLNSTYNIRIKAYVNGVWGDYGTVCTVTTPSPASLPQTELRSSDCGISLAALNRVIYCNAISGASNYEWNIVNVSQGINYTERSGSAYTGYRLSWVPGIQAGSTYEIKIKAEIGGSWADYGDVCLVSTPSAGNLPTTKLKDADCGSTVSSLGSAIYCNPIVGATNYEWNIVNVGQGLNHTERSGSSNNSYRLSWVPGLQVNSTYEIKVKAYISGSWADYGDVCTVTTPLASALPTIDVRSADCGITVPSMSSVIYTEQMSGATSYEWNVVNVGDGVNYTFNSGNAYKGFRLNQVPGLQTNTTYDIRVRAYIGGGVTNYGAVCQVTSAASFKWGDESFANSVDQESIGDMVIYPNPNQGDRLNIVLPPTAHDMAQISIHNLLGELVYIRDFNKGSDKTIIDLNIGDLNMSKGMYIVSATSGDQKFQQKLNIR